MTIKLSNNATSRLAVDLSPTETALSVMPGDGVLFPALNPGETFPVTVAKADGMSEIMLCTARSSDVFTVSRAQEGTVPRAFSMNDIVQLRLTAGALKEMIAQEIEPFQAQIDIAKTADGTSFTPEGSIEATDVQSALVELDADIAATNAEVDGKQPTGDYATNTALTTGLATKQPTGDYATNTALTAGLATKQPTGAYAVLRADNTFADGTALTSSNLPSFAAAGNNGTAAALRISNGGNVNASAGIVFHRFGLAGLIFGLDTNNKLSVGGYSMGQVSYEVWHAGSFNPSSKANAGAQTQWNTGVVEFGSLQMGAPAWGADCPAPYVVIGLRGAGNAFVLRGAALRNQ